MSIVVNSSEPAIVRGIKMVGVGKKGSRALDAPLALEILEDLKSNRVPQASRGAFFAALMSKGIEPQEEIFFSAFAPGAWKNPQAMANDLAPDAPDFVRWICAQLLSGQTLDCSTAYDLGKFLFSDEPGDGARGLVASLLRVRYETPEEIEGLRRAMQESIGPAFKRPVPNGDPIVQIAEPFNGNDHSFMITPVVAQYIQHLGYRAVHMVGRNSGPKLVLNLCDVAEDLNAAFVHSSDDLTNEQTPYGFFVHQRDVSVSLDRWVDIRRQIIKRPFLATLEKFVKPFDARLIIASAFHPPYGEKMITISENAGFPGIIIVRNGIEGSIAFPLKRPTKILLSARQKDGTYKRHEMIFDGQALLGDRLSVEEKRESLTVVENVGLIKEHARTGKSGDQWFDERVKATCLGLSQAIQWIKENTHDLG